MSVEAGPTLVKREGLFEVLFFLFFFFSGCLFLGPGCPFVPGCALFFNYFINKDGIYFLSHLTSVFPYSKGGGGGLPPSRIGFHSLILFMFLLLNLLL
jgi:hypothetical protein